MSSNFMHLFLATEVGTTIDIGRPWLFLVMVPAFILAIFPFFRLHKSRRWNVKHVVPLILHILILALSTALITDIAVVETTTAPEDTKIVVVADMSQSNSAMKDKMNDYIKSLKEGEDEFTEIGVLVFAEKYTYFSDFGEKLDDYLDVTEATIKPGNTNIQSALEYIVTDIFKVDTEKVNKRVILLSDGRQTIGNAWSAAKKLSSENIRLDAAYFDVLNDEATVEVQMLSMNATVIEEKNANVSIDLALTSTSKETLSGKITFYEVPQGSTEGDEQDDIEVFSSTISIKEGNNTYSFKYMAEGAGIHSVYAVVEPEEGGDTISQNNVLYSWFSIDGVANILLVDGDGKQVTSTIKSMVEKNGCTYEEISTTDFPDVMEELLLYDEIVFMNIDFADLPTGGVDLVKRYVEEIGRGVVFTCGSNTYNYNDKTYANNPLIDILPVDLKIDERREVIATVLTVDLSSSMGQPVEGQTNKYGQKMTRYDMVLESVIALLDTEQFTPEDYVGLVFFDADASIAMPLTQLEEKEWMIEQINYSFESFFYAHSDETNPSYSNRVGGGEPLKNHNDANGYLMKPYGTNYKFAIDAANKMLSESDADLKQMVFLSDGEPSDKGSGYDNTVRRMADAGVTTSTIAIGRDQATMLDELSKLAAIGHGNFSYVSKSLDLEQSLIKIAQMIKGEPINERDTKLEKRNDGAILVGIPTGEGTEFDTIGGYYGTTIKNGAKMILSADDLRPIIAEWDYGLGHTTVYMSDLGGAWSRSLFNDNDGFANSKIVENLLINSINDKIGSSGLKVTSQRVDDVTRLTIETQKRLRDDEHIVVYKVDPDGTRTEIVITSDNRVADTRYRTEITTDDESGTYHLEIKLQSKEDAQTIDRTEYAVVGFYPDEYNLNLVNGGAVIEDLATAGGGKIMPDSESFYDIQKDEFVELPKDISTPVVIAILLLFLLDIVFRHFSPKKKDKGNTMTEEERIASMRGR